MITDAMFSSKTDEWATPQEFFDALDSEFHFTLDAAADATNHKCEKYYDKAHDGLENPWGGGNILQSSLWTADREVGAERLRRVQEWYNGCHATSSEDGHEMVSRLHTRQSGNPILAWTLEVRRMRKQRTVSINGCDLRRGR